MSSATRSRAIAAATAGCAKSLPAYYEYIQRVIAHPAVAAAMTRERVALDTFKG